MPVNGTVFCAKITGATAKASIAVANVLPITCLTVFIAYFSLFLAWLFSPENLKGAHPCSHQEATDPRARKRKTRRRSIRAGPRLVFCYALE
jgi:hypothetical protein